MKVAKMQIEVVSLFCPNCGEAFANAHDYAQNFTAQDIGYHIDHNINLSCDSCGKEAVLPVAANKIGTTNE